MFFWPWDWFGGPLSRTPAGPTPAAAPASASSAAPVAASASVAPPAPKPAPAVGKSEPPPPEPAWLIAARSCLGTRETPGAGDNPTIMGWAKKAGGKIAKVFTGDSIPWCALFANYVLAAVGLKGTGTLWALDFANWGRKLAGPAVGAFAAMKRNGGGHIAIVIGRTAKGDLVCIGGNQSDAVTIAVFDPARVVAWTWPAEVAPPKHVGWQTLPILTATGRRSANEA